MMLRKRNFVVLTLLLAVGIFILFNHESHVRACFGWLVDAAEFKTEATLLRCEDDWYSLYKVSERLKKKLMGCSFIGNGYSGWSRFGSRLRMGIRSPYLLDGANRVIFSNFEEDSDSSSFTGMFIDVEENLLVLCCGRTYGR